MLPGISTCKPKELTNREKNIYNSFLATSRKVKNKPFKYRENFDNLDDEKFVNIKKLSNFLEKYPHINWNDFFTAPYKVYQDYESFYDLSFYNSRKAVVCYTKYVKLKETESPDSDEVINNCKSIYKFIYRYCVDNNIKLKDYIHHKPPKNAVPIWLVHLKEHKINFYILHSLEIEKVTRLIEPEILNFYITDFYNMLNQTKIKYITSNKLKNTLSICLQKLSLD